VRVFGTLGDRAGSRTRRASRGSSTSGTSAKAITTRNDGSPGSSPRPTDTTPAPTPYAAVISAIAAERWRAEVSSAPTTPARALRVDRAGRASATSATYHQNPGASAASEVRARPTAAAVRQQRPATDPVGQRRRGEARERRQPDDRERDPDGGRRETDLRGDLVAGTGLAEVGGDVADHGRDAELRQPRRHRQHRDGEDRSGQPGGMVSATSGHGWSSSSSTRRAERGGCSRRARWLVRRDGSYRARLTDGPTDEERCRCGWSPGT
jgi:hypothetical protein